MAGNSLLTWAEKQSELCANSIKHAQAEENDINVFVINGSHTSKCSFLDSESITIHTLEVGYRWVSFVHK
ncbi:MAG: hypothetical protein QW606_03900, partial [Conexivisphaerales archaeon]